MRDAPPGVFVYAGQLTCDSPRGRRRRLKSLVVPEIIVMSLQLVSVEEQSTGRHSTRLAVRPARLLRCHYWYLQLCFGGVDNLEARVCLARGVLSVVTLVFLRLSLVISPPVFKA